MTWPWGRSGPWTRVALWGCPPHVPNRPYVPTPAGGTPHPNLQPIRSPGALTSAVTRQTPRAARPVRDLSLGRAESAPRLAAQAGGDLWDTAAPRQGLTHPAGQDAAQHFKIKCSPTSLESYPLPHGDSKRLHHPAKGDGQIDVIPKNPLAAPPHLPCPHFPPPPQWVSVPGLGR